MPQKERQDHGSNQCREKAPFLDCPAKKLDNTRLLYAVFYWPRKPFNLKKKKKIISPGRRNHNGSKRYESKVLLIENVLYQCDIGKAARKVKFTSHCTELEIKQIT